MKKFWVPPTVSRELQDSTAQYRGEVHQMARHAGIVQAFNKELRAIDPHLQMVWFDEDVVLEGVVPGRYHLLRDAPGVPPTLEPICGPNGEFMEPNSGLFNWLRESDMWNAEARRDRERRQEEARRSAERVREREREEIREELLDRYNAHFRTSVSMDRSSPWSQNSRGRRGRSGFRRAA
jgi:hypothetical protein